LQRRGCDETCQALGALLSADLVRQAVTQRAGPVVLHIDHVDYEVELRVRAARIGAVSGEDELVLMRRLATSLGSGRHRQPTCHLVSLRVSRRTLVAVPQRPTEPVTLQSHVGA
jgi:hypothetical protein